MTALSAARDPSLEQIMVGGMLPEIPANHVNLLYTFNVDRGLPRPATLARPGDKLQMLLEG